MLRKWFIKIVNKKPKHLYEPYSMKRSLLITIDNLAADLSIQM